MRQTARRTIDVRRIVLVAGVWNLIIACAVLTAAHIVPDAARQASGVRSPGVFWMLILCGVLGITGVVLVLASRDLASRGSIVYYEGLARLVAAALLLTLGIRELGVLAAVIGIADLGFGLVQTLGTPRALGRTHAQMLMDDRDPKSTGSGSRPSG